MSEPFHRERHIEGAYHVNPIFMTVDAVRMAQPTQMTPHSIDEDAGQATTRVTSRATLRMPR